MAKRRFRMSRLFLTGLMLIGGGTLAGLAYLQHPLFGKLPDGERLARIRESGNQVDGTFRNQIETPLLTTDETQLELWLGNFNKQNSTHPPAAIPAIRTDLKALDLTQDLVVWLGHSSYFVQLGGQRILIDPVFSANAAPVMRANVAFEGTNVYGVDDVPEIDVLLISHDHYDHLDYPTVTALQPRVRQAIVGLGVGAHLEAWGYNSRQVHEADWYEPVQASPELQVHATPARHFSGRAFTRDKTQWVGFALMTSRHRIFFSGDSGYGPHFSEIGRRYGPFDWAALDMGQYDRRWANVHMTPEQAAQAAEELGTHVLTPGHVGRFSIAPHDWDDPFRRIAVATRQHRYALWTPVIGQPVYLDGRPQEFSPWWETVKPH